VPIQSTNNHTINNHDNDELLMDETDDLHMKKPSIDNNMVQSDSSLVDNSTQNSTNKRPISDIEVDLENSLTIPKSKKAKIDIEEMEVEKPNVTVEKSVEVRAGTTTSLPKVKVGNLEYPAHPYTVRVSQLRHDVCDMDLVDALRTRCGAIVHARLIRDKGDHHSQHINSHPVAHKGWGLVQFEERDAVIKAIELNDTISIKEKLVHIEHSHIPAVSLVPPGMHRVSPAGSGKVSKRNEKLRQQRQQSRDGNNQTVQESNIPGETQISTKSNQSMDESESAPTVQPALELKATAPKKPANLLSFRPRAVARAPGGVRKQPKLSIDRTILKGPDIPDK
jgi:RNA recognition motif-containing protein